ncbi:MAG: T9SS C-terminal target domain-containing protein [Calditrichaeota bacterium]|nr:MAG: T9SS C-terminal target domain-containing protein [Calditrichota bacterium]
MGLIMKNILALTCLFIVLSSVNAQFCPINLNLTGNFLEIEESTEFQNNDVNMGNAVNNCLEGFNSNGSDYLVSFVPPTSGKYDFVLENYNFDAQLYVLSQCNPLVCVQGANVSGFSSSPLNTLALPDVNLQAGVNYIVAVDGWQSNDYGDFKLSIGENLVTFGTHFSDPQNDFVDGTIGDDLKKISTNFTSSGVVFELEFYGNVKKPSLFGNLGTFASISIDLDKNEFTGNPISYSDQMAFFSDKNHLGCELFLDIGTYLKFNGSFPSLENSNISDEVSIWDENWSKIATENNVVYSQNKITVTLGNNFLNGVSDFNFAVGAETFAGTKDIVPEFGRLNTALPTDLNETPNQTLPTNFHLSNFPNPFNPTTTINYELRITNYKFGKLVICNVIGQKVKEFVLENAKGSVIWNGIDYLGNQVASGIYFYRIETGFENSKIHKMVLIK